jgi:enamine deaminase RidA (YjgF/YER057c/UK114 family)
MAVTRHEPSKLLSKVVEANGFVFTAGITSADRNQDAKGQTEQILKEKLIVS